MSTKWNTNSGFRVLEQLSHCLTHDAVAVYVFIKSFNDYLSSSYPFIEHLVYFSDGAPSQFKNFKHFANISCHQEDFKQTAVWNFHATAHGKGPCDGADAVLKNMASKASLQMTGDTLIRTPHELYEWAKKDNNLKKSEVMFKRQEDYNQIKAFLEQRFEKCTSVVETQQLHYIQPRKAFKLRVKYYSSATEFKDVSLLKVQKPERKRQSCKKLKPAEKPAKRKRSVSKRFYFCFIGCLLYSI